MEKKLKSDLKDMKTQENSKFMNLMMTAMMMTNYNSMITPPTGNFKIKKSNINDKYTPTSILQDLGVIPSNASLQDKIYQQEMLSMNNQQLMQPQFGLPPINSICVLLPRAGRAIKDVDKG